MPGRRGRLAGVAAALGLLLSARVAAAETAEVRIAQQPGLSYLPLTVMREEKLLERMAAEAGLGALQTRWTQFGAGNAMNEGILTGDLDIASGGVGPFLTIWSKTRGRQQVKALAALNAMPMYLVTINPAVHSLRDFTEKDRIAMPTVRISIQAVTLEMAAEQAFGDGQWARLNPLTVEMAHPDAMTALLSGRTEVTAHFGSAPFQYQELEYPGAHRVLSSYDALGGPATFNLVWTGKAFHDANPKTCAVFMAALERSFALIRSDPARAAEVYNKAESSKLPAGFVDKMIRDPENLFATAPLNLMKYARFMRKIGDIDEEPADWQALFFPEIGPVQGS
ncbi:MAG: ABC transporter substrate-binding protein [Alphaproteobacteria bacterium]|nr:ABC transporter substrate-binding protein [Alphaproteobacteria bacterium]